MASSLLVPIICTTLGLRCEDLYLGNAIRRKTFIMCIYISHICTRNIHILLEFLWKLVKHSLNLYFPSSFNENLLINLYEAEKRWIYLLKQVGLQMVSIRCFSKCLLSLWLMLLRETETTGNGYCHLVEHKKRNKK